jgi:hypothetical protein
MAPEYAMRGLYSIKSDVFSFGVLVLEIVTGRRNGGSYSTEQDIDLINTVGARRPIANSDPNSAKFLSYIYNGQMIPQL